MKDNKTNKYKKQIELANQGERKPTMPRPTVIPDKKKEVNKNVCRKKTQSALD